MARIDLVLSFNFHDKIPGGTITIQDAGCIPVPKSLVITSEGRFIIYSEPVSYLFSQDGGPVTTVKIRAGKEHIPVEPTPKRKGSGKTKDAGVDGQFETEEE